RLPSRSGGKVFKGRGDSLVVLVDIDDFGVVADQGTQLPPKRLPDLAHTADRLKHRRLKIVGLAKQQHGPEARMEQIAQRHGIRKRRAATQAAPWITIVTSPITAVGAFDESIIRKI